MKKYDTLSYIVGERKTVEKMVSHRGAPDMPFSAATMEFLGTWSDMIRELPRENNDPATAAFGLWSRRAGTLQMKQEYPDITDDYAGRGICLQFVPNNIPALFAYSLAAGLLAGNSVIMRLPSGFDVQVPLIDTLKRAIEKCPEYVDRVVLISYPHSAEITDWLSSVCDERIIWGGDAAISEIQKSRIRGNVAETVFPNRHSMAVLSARSVLESADISGLVRGFFNDTYLNDQNACSSPGIIYWLGSRKEADAARDRFWNEMERFLAGRYTLQAETSVKKTEQAMLLAGLGLADSIDTGAGNSVVRVHAGRLTEALWDHLANGGFFIEADGRSLDDIAPLLTSVCQTVACYGDMPDGSTVSDVVTQITGRLRSEDTERGSFQVVSVGHTLDFSLIWDGQDLIRNMCRMKTEEYMIARPGGSIYARKQGSGPAILLIHGVGVDCEYFRDAATVLEHDFTVLTYDRRGYSRSIFAGSPRGSVKEDVPDSAKGRREEDFSGRAESSETVGADNIDPALREQVLDAAAVIEELAGGGPVLVCGCSAGGLIALELARSMPRYVNKLLLYETAYTVNPESLKRVDAWRADLESPAAQKSLARAMLLFIKAIGKPDPMAPENSPEQIQRNMSNLEVFLNGEIDPLLGYSERHPDFRLQIPCILGAGSMDRDNLFYGMMEETARMWGAPFEVLTGCHNLCEDRPDTFAGWIKRSYPEDPDTR